MSLESLEIAEEDPWATQLALLKSLGRLGAAVTELVHFLETLPDQEKINGDN